jgi:hypothetical protein
MCWRQATVRPLKSEAATAAPNEVVIGVVQAIHSSSAASIAGSQQVRFERLYPANGIRHTASDSVGTTPAKSLEFWQLEQARDLFGHGGSQNG